MHCRTSHTYGHLMSKLDYEDGELWWTGQRKCVCRTCMLVNGSHAPEPKSSNSIPSTYVGELVHSDTKGALKCESVGGCKYQCVIIDDYSNFARVYNIRSKKQTLECLDKSRMLLSKHGHTIKAMRSDYGSEYFNTRTEHRCAKHHISNSSSAPHRHNKIQNLSFFGKRCGT